MRKNLHLFAALLWTSIIIVLFLIRLDGAPKVAIVNFDKYVHTTFHFVFTLLWFLFFRLQFNKTDKYKPFVVPFIMSLILGISIELLQQFCTQSRSGDILDVVANTFGATLAIGFCYTLVKLNILKK